MCRAIARLGDAAGRLTERGRQRGRACAPGIAVAVANVDAHVSVPAATVTDTGTLVAIMGTSTCHIVLADDAPIIPGACGVVRDGVIPGPLSATRPASRPSATSSPGSSSTACRRSTTSAPATAV